MLVLWLEAAPLPTQLQIARPAKYERSRVLYAVLDTSVGAKETGSLLKWYTLNNPAIVYKAHMLGMS
jgi:hypothetical protein